MFGALSLLSGNTSALIPLIFSMASKRVDELSREEVADVLKVAGVEVDLDDELLQAGVALMHGENIHTVADMIKSPDSVARLVTFIRNGVAPNASFEDELYATVARDNASTPVFYSHPNVGFRIRGE